jgi:hypothetical protein
MSAALRATLGRTPFGVRANYPNVASAPAVSVQPIHLGDGLTRYAGDS